MAISLIKEEERHILGVLPFLLKKDNQFRGELYSILIETFATKEDFKQILEELRLSREETNRRFEEQREETSRRFKEQREETDKRFKEQREETDKRFKEQREETNRQFKEQREETNKRFEAVDKRFESIDKRFDEQGAEIKATRKAVDETRKDIDIKIGTLGSRWGIFAEGTIRNTLRELLLRHLKVNEISEWKERDEEGFVFGYPAEIQIDLLAKNDCHLLIEIKSSANRSDVVLFSKKAELYQKKTDIKPELLLVAVSVAEKAEDACKNLNVSLITYDELA